MVVWKQIFVMTDCCQAFISSTSPLIFCNSSLLGTYPIEQSPWKYFMEAMYSGNSLQSTTTIGDEKERQRVYDTIFRLPWRCELVTLVFPFILK